MAEEITRTVENVDRLFSEIVVNGESHVSENYVPPVQLGQQNVGNASPVEETQGEDVYGVKLNDILHNLKDQATAQALTGEITARQDADGVLQQSINTVAGDVTVLQGAVSTIQSEIPNQASSSNQLADKNFVNSSIATNTANFIGTFESVSQLRAYAGTVTNNDYAFVRNTVVQYNGGDFPNVSTLSSYDKTTLTNGDYAWVVNSEDNTKYDLYRFDIVEQSWVLRNTKIDKSADVLNSFYNRYKATVASSIVTWAYEYTLNNSSFTAQQWATINSGLTQSSVDQDIADALASIAVPTKVTVSANRTDTVQGDMQYFVDTAGVVLTLNFGSTNCMKAEVYAIEDCSVTYYADASTTATLSMLAGTSVTLVYFNGWKLCGTYGAVWN